MAIFSYIVTPIPGEKDALASNLSNLQYCQIIPSNNQEVIILVTEAPDQESEALLKEKLKGIKSIESLSLTYGHSE